MGTNSEIQNHPTNTDQLRNHGLTSVQTEKQNRPSKKQLPKFYCLIAAALILMSLCSPAVAESFIPVMSSDTLDYYVGYGEPEITAALRGNQELGKGETASLQIAVANKGLLEKVVYREYVIAANMTPYIEDMALYEPDSSPGGSNYVPNGSVSVIKFDNYTTYLRESSDMGQQNALAQAEMTIEANRVNAESLNMRFVCDSPYIEVDNSGDYAYLTKLNSGSYSVVSIPIKISPDTPAGEYIVNMTVNYKYPSNAKMIKAGNGTDGFTTFLYADSYVQEYTGITETIQIPIYVSSGAVFETAQIEETIRAGKTKTITVTYTNIGDETAYNAEAKLSLMYPLSATRNKALLGDVAPGESVVVDYPITAHSSAIEKVYGVNTDIRYYDEDDKLQIAPSVKMDISMVNPYTLFTFKNALIGVIALVILSLVYDYTKGKKKKKDEDGNESETAVTEMN